MSQSGKRDEVLALWRGISEGSHNKETDPDAAPAGDAAPRKRGCMNHPVVKWYTDGPAKRCRAISHKSWFVNVPS